MHSLPISPGCRINHGPYGIGRKAVLALLAAGTLPLGGCVAGIAASAAGMAIRSSQPKPESNRHLQPAARAACSDQASQYGAVHIIDVQQRFVNRIIVCGTVDDGRERRSFECQFTTQIVGFKLREIRAPR